MSYGSSPTLGKNKGGGLIFLIMIGIGLFLLFSNRGRLESPESQTAPTNQDAKADDVADTIPGRSSGDLSSGGDFVPQAMPSNGSASKSGDWDIQDASKSTVETKPTPSNGNDWSIDDASGKTAKDQFKFSDPKNNPAVKDAPKGDWSIDDAGGSGAKKTENGDWVIEDGLKDKKK